MDKDTSFMFTTCWGRGENMKSQKFYYFQHGCD